MVEKLFVSWDQIQESCELLAKDIKRYEETHNKFDCILALGRGGLIPSRLLSEYLDIKDIYMFNIRMYKDQKISQLQSINFDYKLVENKNVLIVDDVATTMSTMNYVTNYLTSINNKFDYSKVTIFRNIDLKCGPDFYNRLYDARTTWIVFPWEKE